MVPKSIQFEFHGLTRSEIALPCCRVSRLQAAGAEISADAAGLQHALCFLTVACGHTGQEQIAYSSLVGGVPSRIAILNATSAVGIRRFQSRDRPIACACCGNTPAIRPGIALAGAAGVAAAFAVEPARTADVRVADLLATGALGPGLPQPAPAGPTGGVGLAPVNYHAFSLASPAGRGRIPATECVLPEVRARDGPGRQRPPRAPPGRAWSTYPGRDGLTPWLG